LTLPTEKTGPLQERIMKHLPETKGRVPWINDRLILLVTHGSNAYGTAVPTSDLDLKGVAIAPKEYYYGFLQTFHQAEYKEPDAVVYELRKFCKLAADCNPNIIEVLWTDPSDYRYVSEAGQKLLDNRDKFLSKKAKFTFSGYAISQLKRIKSHREWLLNPPEALPERKDFGLPEQSKLSRAKFGAIETAVKNRMDQWGVNWEVVPRPERIALREQIEKTLTEMGVATHEDQWGSAARLIGMEENFVQLIQAEKRYRQAKLNWKQYQEWKENRNPVRAELEAKYGFDCKHGSHLVRLLRMGEEILRTGKVIVKRPDAEELLAIRNGAWSYDKLVEWAEAKDELLNKLYKESDVLPREPDRDYLDQLCCELAEDAMRPDTSAFWRCMCDEKVWTEDADYQGFCPQCGKEARVSASLREGAWTVVCRCSVSPKHYKKLTGIIPSVETDKKELAGQRRDVAEFVYSAWWGREGKQLQ
jgi:predicted nucleotidyltransferase